MDIPDVDRLSSVVKSKEEVVDSPDVDFEPVVRLPSVEVKNMEENEEEIFKM